MTEEGERRTPNSEGRKSRNTPRRGVKLEVQQGRPRPMIAVHEAEAQFSALEAPSAGSSAGDPRTLPAAFPVPDPPCLTSFRSPQKDKFQLPCLQPVMNLNPFAKRLGQLVLICQ